MVFEEWLAKYKDELPNDITAHRREEVARAAWEAGYTAATHDILENVKRMNRKKDWEDEFKGMAGREAR
jgi:hypothetical protein